MCSHTYLQLPPSSTQPENPKLAEKASMAVVPGGFPSCLRAGRKESSDPCLPTLLPCKTGSPHYCLRAAELLLLGAAGKIVSTACCGAQTNLVEMLTSGSRSEEQLGQAEGDSAAREGSSPALTGSLQGSVQISGPPGLCFPRDAARTSAQPCLAARAGSVPAVGPFPRDESTPDLKCS